MSTTLYPVADFIKAATWHGSLEKANAMLIERPELAASGIHAAAILGDDSAVRHFLEQDPGSVSATAPPYDAEPLVYLCLSKYLRLEPARTDAFLRAATALLDAGANPNAGFMNKGEWETALYGAAGVAHHAPLTRLLLERGADPNDGEVVYHSPESYDLEAMKAVVETGRLSGESMAILLLRKLDWHDHEGVKYLLGQKIDVERDRWREKHALHHAVSRHNSIEIIDLLLDHGADPLAVEDGLSVVARAAHAGRGEVLKSLERRGVAIELPGVDRLIAACALNDSSTIRAVTEQQPELVRQLVAHGGELLTAFAATGNLDGVRQLLDLGVPAGAVFKEGDGYFDIAPDSMALHAAAWCMYHSIVKLLIERGAPVDAPDGRGRTPLTQAVRACVDSYWTEWRSPTSVKMLLEAGASIKGVPYPSGYAEVDELLKQRGAA